MPKKKGSRWHRYKKWRKGYKSKAVPVAPLLGALVPVLTAYQLHQPQNSTDEALWFIDRVMQGYTGYSFRERNFDFMIPVNRFMVPVAVGSAAHIIANVSGANKAIAKVPLIGKYLRV